MPGRYRRDARKLRELRVIVEPQANATLLAGLPVSLVVNFNGVDGRSFAAQVDGMDVTGQFTLTPAPPPPPAPYPRHHGSSGLPSHAVVKTRESGRRPAGIARRV